MKKIIGLSVILALSTLQVVEAKPRSVGRSVAVKPATTKSSSQNAQTQQKDATFENTVPRTAAQAQQAAQANQSGRLANFATGAMAGYLLGEMLTPEAQAQEQAQQAVSSESKIADSSAQVAIPVFKAIDPANDPFLIEKSPGYSRYCLNGVQYLISANATQLPPTLMVDKTGAPVSCLISKE